MGVKYLKYGRISRNVSYKSLCQSFANKTVNLKFIKRSGSILLAGQTITKARRAKSFVMQDQKTGSIIPIDLDIVSEIIVGIH